MKYQFDEIIPRRNTHSVKWDSADSDRVLPMWVADMDFRTAPPVIAALQWRVQHGVFGYAKTPKSYFEAITRWFEQRHGVTYLPEWTLCTTGVIPALSAIIRALTVPGDAVIAQTPVYNCFFSSIRNNGCELAANQLKYSNGRYTVDFNDLQEKAANPRTKLLLLCSPHNPAGRVWSREELTQIGEICFNNGVTVVSDEIHCDLVYPGLRHIPFASLGDTFLIRSVTCTAPSKTFNLAGIQVANIHAADPAIREKINRALNINEVCEINAFAIEALTAAYSEGAEWLDELIEYLHGNYLFLKDFFNRHLPHLPILPLEATYLVWIDCRALNCPSAEITDMLLQNENLQVNPGTLYGAGGENFIRINIACPRTLLIEGLNRIKHALTR